jgi:putative sterol carrier protein
MTMTTSTFDSIPDVLTAIQSSFDPQAAAGARATIQFEFTGEHGGRYWLAVYDGVCTHGAGDATPPINATVVCRADVCLAILNGSMRAIAAVAQGKVRVSGDLSLAMQLQRWFPKRI